MKKKPLWKRVVRVALWILAVLMVSAAAYVGCEAYSMPLDRLVYCAVHEDPVGRTLCSGALRFRSIDPAEVKDERGSLLKMALYDCSRNEARAFEVADLLLRKGCKVDGINKEGLTPLMDAVIENDLPAASFLVSRGANASTPGAGSFAGLNARELLNRISNHNTSLARGVLACNDDALQMCPGVPKAGYESVMCYQRFRVINAVGRAGVAVPRWKACEPISALDIEAFVQKQEANLQMTAMRAVIGPPS